MYDSEEEGEGEGEDLPATVAESTSDDSFLSDSDSSSPLPLPLRDEPSSDTEPLQEQDSDSEFLSSDDVNMTLTPQAIQQSILFLQQQEQQKALQKPTEENKLELQVINEQKAALERLQEEQRKEPIVEDIKDKIAESVERISRDYEIWRNQYNQANGLPPMNSGSSSSSSASSSSASSSSASTSRSIYNTRAAARQSTEIFIDLDDDTSIRSFIASALWDNVSQHVRTQRDIRSRIDRLQKFIDKSKAKMDDMLKEASEIRGRLAEKNNEIERNRELVMELQKQAEKNKKISPTALRKQVAAVDEIVKEQQADAEKIQLELQKKTGEIDKYQDTTINPYNRLMRQYAAELERADTTHFGKQRLIAEGGGTELYRRFAEQIYQNLYVPHMKAVYTALQLPPALRPQPQPPAAPAPPPPTAAAQPVELPQLPPSEPAFPRRHYDRNPPPLTPFSSKYERARALRNAYAEAEERERNEPSDGLPYFAYRAGVSLPTPPSSPKPLLPPMYRLNNQIITEEEAEEFDPTTPSDRRRKPHFQGHNTLSGKTLTQEDLDSFSTAKPSAAPAAASAAPSQPSLPLLPLMPSAPSSTPTPNPTATITTTLPYVVEGVNEVVVPRERREKRQPRPKQEQEPPEVVQQRRQILHEYFANVPELINEELRKTVNEKHKKEMAEKAVKKHKPKRIRTIEKQLHFHQSRLQQSKKSLEEIKQNITPENVEKQRAEIRMRMRNLDKDIEEATQNIRSNLRKQIDLNQQLGQLSKEEEEVKRQINLNAEAQRQMEQSIKNSRGFRFRVSS